MNKLIGTVLLCILHVSCTDEYVQRDEDTENAGAMLEAGISSDQLHKDYVALKTEIPEQIMHGHTGHFRDPSALINMSLYPHEVESIMVPKNAKNLTVGKTVTTNVGPDQIILGSLKMLTDGTKNRREGNWLELYTGEPNSPVWIQVDLGRSCSIHGVWLWRYWGESSARIIHGDTVVQVGNDPDFKSDIITIFNNDIDNSMKLGVGRDKSYFETRYGKLVAADGIEGRYVRVYSGGDLKVPYIVKLIEIEVHGTMRSNEKGEQGGASDR